MMGSDLFFWLQFLHYNDCISVAVMMHDFTLPPMLFVGFPKGWPKKTNATHIVVFFVCDKKTLTKSVIFGILESTDKKIGMREA